MKAKVFVFSLFLFVAMAASVPAHAQQINVNGVCENDIAGYCLPNTMFSESFIQIFGTNLNNVFEVTVSFNGNQIALPILFNNGNQINVCLLPGQNLIAQNAILTVHGPGTSSVVINISQNPGIRTC
ncbi:MAG TPA: hypothetical protein VKZ53_23295 [Candidatus Angelobacter sp.]|nr:hypothetical protein [Candidatus Angelobacter sp.]